MPNQRITVVLNEPKQRLPIGTQVFVDAVELKNILHVEITLDVKQRKLIHVLIAPDELEVNTSSAGHAASCNCAECDF